MEIKEYREYKEEELLSLYASVGWTAYTQHPETLRAGFANSLFTLGAYDGQTLLGIIRTVGDGHTIVLIQDILVFPEHQRKGIGSKLMQAVLERFRNVRQIELATDDIPANIAFYESLGFRKMSEIGCCAFIRL